MLLKKKLEKNIGEDLERTLTDKLRKNKRIVKDLKNKSRGRFWNKIRSFRETKFNGSDKEVKVTAALNKLMDEYQINMDILYLTTFELIKDSVQKTRTIELNKVDKSKDFDQGYLDGYLSHFNQVVTILDMLYKETK